MQLSPRDAGVRGQSDYPTWLVGETKSIQRSFARAASLLHQPAPDEECWRQELAAIVMQWQIAMLDAQLRGAVPVRFCEFHRWYIGIVEMLTSCGDAVTRYIHRQDELDADVVLRLALKRLAAAGRAWQELPLRLSANPMYEPLSVLESPQTTLQA